jgi:hypothetical protein
MSIPGDGTETDLIKRKRRRVSANQILAVIFVVFFAAYVTVCILWRFFAPCYLYRGHTLLETPNRCVNAAGVVK